MTTIAQPPIATPRSIRGRSTATSARLIRLSLIGVVLIFLALFLIVPLISVFVEAFAEGTHAYFDAIVDPDALSAIRMTFLVAGTAVPLNLVFGLSAAWAISKFEFFGKSTLSALIDLPFAVSPVIAGMVYVLIFGRGRLMGDWLDSPHDLNLLLFHLHVDPHPVIFAVPGMILATTFVTFPFIARELIPLMQAQGNDAEQAAVSLGASGWRTFFHVTLPSIKWALLYGTVLCAARAIGEFGAVSVVSGKIRGETLTMPLYVELMSNDFQFVPAFAISTLLVLLAMLTLVVKTFFEWRADRLNKPERSEP